MDDFGGRVRRCCKNKEYVVGFLNCCGIVILDTGGDIRYVRKVLN